MRAGAAPRYESTGATSRTPWRSPILSRELSLPPLLASPAVRPRRISRRRATTELAAIRLVSAHRESLAGSTIIAQSRRRSFARESVTPGRPALRVTRPPRHYSRPRANGGSPAVQVKSQCIPCRRPASRDKSPTSGEVGATDCPTLRDIRTALMRAITADRARRACAAAAEVGCRRSGLIEECVQMHTCLVADAMERLANAGQAGPKGRDLLSRRDEESRCGVV
jgi:hypothetical protein